MALTLDYTLLCTKSNTVVGCGHINLLPHDFRLDNHLTHFTLQLNTLTFFSKKGIYRVS